MNQESVGRRRFVQALVATGLAAIGTAFIPDRRPQTPIFTGIVLAPKDTNTSTTSALPEAKKAPKSPTEVVLEAEKPPGPERVPTPTRPRIGTATPHA